MKLIPANEFDRDSQLDFIVDGIFHRRTIAATPDKIYRLGIHKHTKRGGALKFTLCRNLVEDLKTFRAGTVAEGIEKSNKWLEKTAAGMNDDTREVDPQTIIRLARIVEV